MIKGIVCLSEDNGIGNKGGLLFHIPEDLAYFKRMTEGDNVVMGNNTYKSLPMYPKGLPNRKNYILCSDWRGRFFEGVLGETYCLSRDSKFEVTECVLEDSKSGVTSWVIGGESIYTLYEEYIEEWYITKVTGTPEADTFFSPDLSDFEKVSRERLTERAEVYVYKRKGS